MGFAKDQQGRLHGKDAKGELETRTVLRLRNEVIAFHEVPVTHTGVHLAEIFMRMLNRVGVLKKVRDGYRLVVPVTNIVLLQIGWVSCDNASNNDTMLQHLEQRLVTTEVDFQWRKNHIRSINPSCCCD